MSSKHGSFCDEGTVRIDHPRTPRPWTNLFNQSDRVGSRNNEQDPIYLNVQAPHVNLGMADEERADQATDAIERRGGYFALACRPWNHESPTDERLQAVPGNGTNGSALYLETARAARSFLGLGRQQEAF